MTKKAQSKRTDPLDRDGDGAKGGSLPDNQTAPYAQGADDADAKAPPAETAREGEAPAPDANPDGNPDRPDDGPPNSDAEPPAETPAVVTGESAPETPTEDPQPWTRDDTLIVLKLGEAGIATYPDKEGGVAEDTIGKWSDEEAQTAERWADQMNAEGSFTCESGEWMTADKQLIETPDVLNAYLFRKDPAADYAGDATADPATPPQPEPDPQTPAEPGAKADPGPTFSPEEIAAGKRGVAGEDGETADQPEAVQEDLALIQTDQAPVAVRIRELRALLEHRRLYRTEEGYSATQHPPYISVDTVTAWTQAGLCEHVPSAGRMGGIKPTVKARSEFNQLTAEHGGR